MPLGTCGATRPAACEELKVRTLHRGRYWRIKLPPSLLAAVLWICMREVAVSYLAGDTDHYDHGIVPQFEQDRFHPYSFHFIIPTVILPFGTLVWDTASVIK